MMYVCVGEGVTECKWRRTFNCHYMNRQTDNAPSCINPLATVEKMDRWKQKKRRKENLFFDCLVQKPCLKKKSYDAVTKVLERR